MPKRVKATDWLCVSAYVRALEGRLLTAADYHRMLEAQETADVLRVLQDHGYAVTGGSQAEVEEAIRAAREALIEDFAGFSMDMRLLDMFRIRYDYHNAKVVLKAAAAGVEADDLLMEGGRFDKAVLAQRLREEEDEQLPPLMAEAAQEARLALAAGEPRRGDLALDRACYGEMTALAEELGSPFISGYVRLMIDAENVKTLLRVERMYGGAELMAEAALEGGEVSVDTLLIAVENGAITEPYQATPLSGAVEHIAQVIHGGSVTGFERSCDDTLMHYLQGAALVPFGPEAVLAYFAAREQEFRNIRILMNGRSAGLSAEKLRERMRESYV